MKQVPYWGPTNDRRHTVQKSVARDLCFSVKGYKYLKCTSCNVVCSHPSGKIRLEQCFFFLLYPNVLRDGNRIDGDALNELYKSGTWEKLLFHFNRINHNMKKYQQIFFIWKQEGFSTSPAVKKWVQTFYTHTHTHTQVKAVRNECHRMTGSVLLCD